ncbi:MAG: AAA family ATPase [Aestuariivita sp.]|nr:AAA family ATPase [Aestuariivita sp.]MCY4202802.1 AAA family ATPase [Aestuariivita sp.]
MKLESIEIKGFKRFEDLKIKEIPPSTKLIILAGPNGCGKSSFFDALLTWRTKETLRVRQDWFGFNWEPDYHHKIGSSFGTDWQNNIKVETFGTEIIEPEKVVYARSAYRNDPEFNSNNMSRIGNIYQYLPARRMIDNDASTSRNYNLLVGQTIERLFDGEGGSITKDEYAQQILGDIKHEFNNIFENLQIDNLGNPYDTGTFSFSKGTSSGFSYKNLSGGEKAVFDLILDLVIAKRSYDNTIYCIDEPEAHLNTRIQAILLSALYNLVPENCQLILATHSIGIMRKARDIEKENPNTIAFLNFENREFDQKQTITPTHPNRTFWGKVYKVALDDLSELIAPEIVVICEGESKNHGAGRNHDHDARCYETIFAKKYPEAKFLPSLNDQDIINDRLYYAKAFEDLFSGKIRIIRLVDRDDKTNEKIQELTEKGITVLSRRNLETYLYDNEVLQALAKGKGQPDKSDELLRKKNEIISKYNGEDLKQLSGEL